MLEALRLLTNLETTKEKMICLVLFGRPELNQQLLLPEASALRQRIAFSYTLTTLKQEETDAYIPYRVWRAGYQGPPLFHPQAIRAIHQASRGVPRLINILCHKSMIAACTNRAHHVTQEHVQMSIIGTDGILLSSVSPVIETDLKSEPKVAVIPPLPSKKGLSWWPFSLGSQQDRRAS